ncbi:MAG: hypothetical protein A3F68_04725 [Acidobacteria bacterium RIFCSPLOWO2_12_FULL_54_10]|nr:MAG: hypothetical protein A3F68_04725 [Acidobacteria bacterium RIFCSPLOWO2_12_FULL_54_10]
MYFMRLFIAIVIASFFVPVLCEAQYAWSMPDSECKHSGQAPNTSPVIAPCCAFAAQVRPILKEVNSQDTSTTLELSGPDHSFPLIVISSSNRVTSTYQLDPSVNPPDLFLLHASFLI